MLTFERIEKGVLPELRNQTRHRQLVVSPQLFQVHREKVAHIVSYILDILFFHSFLSFCSKDEVAEGSSCGSYGGRVRGQECWSEEFALPVYEYRLQDTFELGTTRE
jgi:hypothetical protein